MRGTGLFGPIVLSVFLTSSIATTIPLRREKIPSDQNALAPGRASMRRSNVDSSPHQVSGFENLYNRRYVANMVLFDQTVSMVIDTGSADLWVVTTGLQTGSSSVQNTSINVEIPYGAQGSYSNVDGIAVISQAQISDLTVPNQAFIATDQTPSSLLTQGVVGLTGLGPPNQGTFIGQAIDSQGYDGQTLFQQLSAQYPELQDQFTMLLSRSNGTSETDGGVMTFGAPASGYEAVEQQPKTSIVDTSSSTGWVVSVDEININGQAYFNSGSDTLSALLDTGTFTAMASQDIVESIYGQNVSFVTADGAVYPVVPCSFKSNVSILIGGVNVILDPLDLTEPSSVSNGVVDCVGAISSLGSSSDGYVYLGDTFLRNAYTLFSGNGWTQAGDPSPYVQLLPTTNADEAWATFDQRNEERLAAVLAAFG